MKKVVVSALAASTVICLLGGLHVQSIEERGISLAQLQPSYAEVEQAILSKINQHRAAQGLEPLELDADITGVARSHSTNMANSSVTFGHDGFNQRAEAVAVQVPYVAISENVAYNQGYSDVASQAVAGWLNSPRHRQNIEGDYNLTGIGVAQEQGKYFITQIFVL